MPKSIMDSSYDPIYDQIRGILGEHFENYCFIVMNEKGEVYYDDQTHPCLLYTSPSPRDGLLSRMPSSA